MAFHTRSTWGPLRLLRLGVSWHMSPSTNNINNQEIRYKYNSPSEMPLMKLLCENHQLLRHHPWYKQCQGNQWLPALRIVWLPQRFLLEISDVSVSIHLDKTSFVVEFHGSSYIPTSVRRHPHDFLALRCWHYRCRKVTYESKKLG